MKIESILIRKGGTKVTLGETEYHFAPQTDGRHVAEVEDEDHIGAFLGIREGYRLVKTIDAAEMKDDGLEALDRVALSELFLKRYGTLPGNALSKPKIIEALRQPEA